MFGQVLACSGTIDGSPAETNTTPSNVVTVAKGATPGTGGSGGSAPRATGGSNAGSAAAGSPSTTPAAGSSSGGQPATTEGGAGGEAPDVAGASGAPAVISDDGVLRIWPLGDSITLGAQGGYRNDLFLSLAGDGLNVDMIGTVWDTSTEIDDKDNEGHPGFTIGNARENVDGWLGSLSTPNVVLIMLGTNDEAWWTTKQPSETKDALMELVDHLLVRLPESVLVVATIPPQSSAIIEPIEMDRAEMTKQFNALSKDALAAHSAYGSRVFSADVNAVLTLDDLYDGIHPTREAHTKVAAVFYDVLKTKLAL
jgi:lysophospholipase L1-like esterase